VRARATGVSIVTCAYCGVRRAVNRDHVIPKALRKNGAIKRRGKAIRAVFEVRIIPEELARTVPCCFECNMRKGTRKLVPPSWAQHIPALKELIPGKWRVWKGDPLDPAFREVHV
jgi:hypothetical protein